jgi:hypothetical protein
VARTRGVRNPHEFVTLEAGEILPQPANRETSVMGIRSRLAWQGLKVVDSLEWLLCQKLRSGN